MKLGFMSAFVKASACALVDSPIANAGKSSNVVLSLYEINFNF